MVLEVGGSRPLAHPEACRSPDPGAPGTGRSARSGEVRGEFEGTGRTVLVTRRVFGIGAAVARELAARGDTVALVARRGDRLDEVLAGCGRVSCVGAMGGGPPIPPRPAGPGPRDLGPLRRPRRRHRRCGGPDAPPTSSD